MPKRQIAIIAAGLVVLVVAINVTFLYIEGDEIAEAFKKRLNTAHHEEDGGGWQNGVEMKKRLWRFVSHRVRSGTVAEARGQAGMHIVQGAYSIVWENSTTRKFKVEYQLGFLDSKDLRLAWTESRDLILLPSSEKETSRIFTIEVDDISVANMAKRMVVTASFENMNEQQGQ